MRRTRGKRRGGWLVVAALLAGGLMIPAEAQSLSSRLRQIVNKRQQVQAQLRGIKQDQRSATVRLHEAQKRLAVLEDRLSDARRQLTTTRKELEAARAEIKRLEELMENHQGAIQAHLVALYRSEQSSYLNVVMQAESFDDFANRQHYARRMVNQDRYLLNRLTDLQAEQERQRAMLEERERQRVALVQQIAADEAESRRRRSEVRELLADANQRRAAAEEMLAAMEREERQIEQQIAASRRGQGPSYAGTWSGSLLRPCPGRISSPFGMRRHPITGRYSLHTGVDIAAPTGTPIKAADTGMVISAGWKQAYGNTVVLDHGSGVYTWYAHCSSIGVRVGQLVQRGQVIARVGSTGYSTGPHLHFGVHKGGRWVNPLSY